MPCLKLLLSIALDTLSVVLVCLPSIVMPPIVKPFHRGFFCDDNTIKYPDRPDTISTAQTISSCILLIACLSAVFETIHYCTKKPRNSPIQTSSGRGGSVLNLLVMLYTVFVIFIFGIMAAQSICHVAKFTIGRLRPNFISVCKPDFTKVNCSSAEHMSIYIEEDICTRPYDKKMIDARLSFPSGHASNAAFTAVFLGLYIQQRVTWKWMRALRHCLQVIIVFGAVFVCLTRINDNRHHWSDVVAGAFIGVVTAVLTGLRLMSLFKDVKRKERDMHQTLPYHNLNSTKEPSENTALLK